MIFEHRLGLALHKSKKEIRSLTYKEFRSWQLFYLLEPFGWGANHAILYNINRQKGKAKSEDDLLNERAQEVLKELQEAPDFSNLSIEEQREALKKIIKKDFGIT